eukprot:Awhi_evm1s5645
MMPDLWSCCGDDNLLRSKIVILLTCIVEVTCYIDGENDDNDYNDGNDDNDEFDRSSPTESTKMNESFLSIVQLSVDPSQ